MIKLTISLHDWESDSFSQTLKNEIENLPAGTLPLHAGTSQGGYVDDSDITATILRVADDKETIQARSGVFFTEIIVGCSCGDDPIPANAYCEMQIDIDKSSGQAAFTIVKE